MRAGAELVLARLLRSDQPERVVAVAAVGVIAAVEVDLLPDVDGTVVDVDLQRVVATQTADLDPLDRGQLEGLGEDQVLCDVQQPRLIRVATEQPAIAGVRACQPEHACLVEVGGDGGSRDVPGRPPQRGRVEPGRRVVQIRHRGVRQPGSELCPDRVVVRRIDGSIDAGPSTHQHDGVGADAENLDGVQVSVRQVPGDILPGQATRGLGRDAVHAIEVRAATVDDDVGRRPVRRVEPNGDDGAGDGNGVGPRRRDHARCAPDEELVTPRCIDDVGVCGPGVHGRGRRIHAAVGESGEPGRCVRDDRGWRDDGPGIHNASAARGSVGVDVGDLPQSCAADQHSLRCLAVE